MHVRSSGSMRCVQSGLGQDTLNHQGVDVDKADLQQVECQHGEFLVLQVVGSDLTAFAVEDEVVGSVPVLDDVETFLNFAPQRFGVEVATQKNRFERLAQFSKS